ncbi:DUF1236 domain-containing protein [Salipiger sp. IMCC34102]|uniref:DUF1236 domain-containing protein n=1 Tax=Salipiger sp. IMCC34102 TaxID=2510647 RepID=UPI00101C702E|nr:DUF1236 domain-containing protein [Salipiger sp. IMCC34102]RYH02149.1 DUF1236 domain-containing protein [Salipiger sp. IMCC34102]
MSMKMMTAVSVAALIAAAPVAAQTMANTATELNVRATPSPFGEISGVLEQGAEVTIDGCLEDVSWCQISSGEMMGWASGQYLYVAEGSEAVPLVNMAGEQAPVTVIERPVEAEAEVADGEVTEGDQTASALATGTVGALTAAAFGGPVGAIVASGIAGTVLGSEVAEPTEETITFVNANPVETVYLDGEVVRGAAIPASVTTYEVPQENLRYLNVNNLPVLVDAETGTIVRILR